MIKTRITEKFGIETPILMGGMTGVGYGELVAAVANAGALGFITAHIYPSGEALKEEIAKTQELTDKPFGVNLTLMPSINPYPMMNIVRQSSKVVSKLSRRPAALPPIICLPLKRPM